MKTIERDAADAVRITERLLESLRPEGLVTQKAVAIAIANLTTTIGRADGFSDVPALVQEALDVRADP